ncbi:hypothetical protein ACFL08_02525 [Patescibacteria group bacterium]
MSWTSKVEERRKSLKEQGEEIAVQVLGIFLSQPTQIGRGIGFLRPIDIINSVNDREIFLKSVRLDIGRLKEGSEIRDYGEIEKTYESVRDLILS